MKLIFIERMVEEKIGGLDIEYPNKSEYTYITADFPDSISLKSKINLMEYKSLDYKTQKIYDLYKSENDYEFDNEYDKVLKLYQEKSKEYKVKFDEMYEKISNELGIENVKRLELIKDTLFYNDMLDDLYDNDIAELEKELFDNLIKEV